MGPRDSIDPSKMAIERSSNFSSEPSSSAVNDASQNKSVNVSLDETETRNNVTEVQKSGEKRKAEKEKQEKSRRKGKEGGEIKSRKVPKTGRVLLWKCGKRVWNRTTQDLNVRQKCSVAPRAGKWNKQTPYLLASKTVFKDLVSE